MIFTLGEFKESDYLRQHALFTENGKEFYDPLIRFEQEYQNLFTGNNEITEQTQRQLPITEGMLKSFLIKEYGLDYETATQILNKKRFFFIYIVKFPSYDYQSVEMCPRTLDQYQFLIEVMRSITFVIENYENYMSRIHNQNHENYIHFNLDSETIRILILIYNFQNPQNKLNIPREVLKSQLVKQKNFNTYKYNLFILKLMFEKLLPIISKPEMIKEELSREIYEIIQNKASFDIDEILTIEENELCMRHTSENQFIQETTEGTSKGDAYVINNLSYILSSLIPNFDADIMNGISLHDIINDQDKYKINQKDLEIIKQETTKKYLENLILVFHYCLTRSHKRELTKESTIEEYLDVELRDHSYRFLHGAISGRDQDSYYTDFGKMGSQKIETSQFSFSITGETLYRKMKEILNPILDLKINEIPQFDEIIEIIYIISAINLIKEEIKKINH